MLFFEIVGAYYGAFFIWQLVTGIMNMLSGKILGGMKFHSFRFLNFKIGESQGRLTLSKDRVCFLPQFKILHTPESMADKRRRTVTLSAGALSGFTVYGLFCLLVYRLSFIMEGTTPAQLGDWLAEEVELSGAGLAEKNRYISFSISLH